MRCTGAFAALKIGTSKQISSEQDSEADITFHSFYTVKISNTIKAHGLQAKSSARLHYTRKTLLNFLAWTVKADL